MRGTWYILPTPFDASGGLDVRSQRNVVDAAIAWGADGLTVMGVMGEANALSAADRIAALETIVETVAGRVPIAVGCSAPSVSLVLELLAQAKTLGAAAAMVAPPPLLRNVDLLPALFRRLAKEGGLPLIVQDEPASSGVLVPVSVLMAIVRESGARTLKVEDPPTPPKIGSLLAQDATLDVFGGLGGVAALSELRRGASGTMTGFAYPEVLRAVRLRLEAGDAAQAARIFEKFLPLIVFEAQPVVGLAIRKEILRRRGVIRTSITRGLAAKLDHTTTDELDEILDRLELRPSRDPLHLTS